MSWLLATPLLLGAAVVAVLVMVLVWRWPQSRVLQVAATVIITGAVLVAIMLTWSAVWWLVQRWWA